MAYGTILGQTSPQPDLSNYVTNDELNNKNYATQSWVNDNYTTKQEFNSKFPTGYKQFYLESFQETISLNYNTSGAIVSSADSIQLVTNNYLQNSSYYDLFQFSTAIICTIRLYTTVPVSSYPNMSLLINSWENLQSVYNFSNNMTIDGNYVICNVNISTNSSPVIQVNFPDTSRENKQYNLALRIFHSFSYQPTYTITYSAQPQLTYRNYITKIM